MSHSVNEIETLAAKAARGIGAPPAQAARFGRALVHHLAQGRPEQDLHGALDQGPDGPILTLALQAGPSTNALHQSYLEAAARQPLPARLTPSTALVTALTELAARTFVPASDASRASGAGAGPAGQTDND